MSALVAGRELDALVAEKVMGWVWATAGLGVPEDRRRAWLKPTLSSIDIEWRGEIKAKHRGVAAAEFGDVPHYSTSIADAWTVVEKLNNNIGDVHLYATRDGFSVHIHEDGTEDVWRASVDPRDGGMPLAICRAALCAVEQSAERSEAPK